MRGALLAFALADIAGRAKGRVESLAEEKALEQAREHARLVRARASVEALAAQGGKKMLDLAKTLSDEEVRKVGLNHLALEQQQQDWEIDDVMKQGLKVDPVATTGFNMPYAFMPQLALKLEDCDWCDLLDAPYEPFMDMLHKGNYLDQLAAPSASARTDPVEGRPREYAAPWVVTMKKPIALTKANSMVPVDTDVVPDTLVVVLPGIKNLTKECNEQLDAVRNDTTKLDAAVKCEDARNTTEHCINHLQSSEYDLAVGGVAESLHECAEIGTACANDYSTNAVFEVRLSGLGISEKCSEQLNTLPGPPPLDCEDGKYLKEMVQHLNQHNPLEASAAIGTAISACTQKVVSEACGQQVGPPVMRNLLLGAAGDRVHAREEKAPAGADVPAKLPNIPQPPPTAGTDPAAPPATTEDAAKAATPTAKQAEDQAVIHYLDKKVGKKDAQDQVGDEARRVLQQTSDGLRKVAVGPSGQASLLQERETPEKADKAEEDDAAIEKDPKYSYFFDESRWNDKDDVAYKKDRRSDDDEEGEAEDAKEFAQEEDEDDDVRPTETADAQNMESLNSNMKDKMSQMLAAMDSNTNAMEDEKSNAVKDIREKTPKVDDSFAQLRKD